MKAFSIMGLPGAGKTTLSNFLCSDFGYVRISVSSATALFSGMTRRLGAAPLSRESLLKAGLSILNNGEEEKFGDFLLQISKEYPLVIFDGIRLPRTQLFLEKRLDLLSVYLKVATEVLVTRVSTRDSISIREANDILSHPIEKLGMETMLTSDIVLDGGLDFDEIKQSIKSFI